MKTLKIKSALALLLLLGMVLFTAPAALAEETPSDVPAEEITLDFSEEVPAEETAEEAPAVEIAPEEASVVEIAEEDSAEQVPAIPTLAETLAQTNPSRSAAIAVSYNGLLEVFAGDTVALIAKLTGYEGLTYAIYWQSFTTTMVDGQEAYGWSDGEGLAGSVYSFTLSSSNAGIARRVKIVITGIEGVETTGSVRDFSDERPAILGDLAVRPDAVEEMETTENRAADTELTEIENNLENIQDLAGETANDVEVLPDADITDEALVETSPVIRNVKIRTTLGSVVNQGDTITMTGVLTGFDDVQVLLQWQVNDGTGWKDVGSATGTQYTFTANGQTVNNDWRLKVTIAD